MQVGGSSGSKLYYGWFVVLITFAALLVAAGIRSMPSILMLPLEEDFGWGRGIFPVWSPSASFCTG